MTSELDLDTYPPNHPSMTAPDGSALSEDSMPAVVAAFERVNIAAREMLNVVQQFPYADKCAPNSRVGRLIAFFRDEFGLS